jgi:rRNA maturation protein Nop10
MDKIIMCDACFNIYAGLDKCPECGKESGDGQAD